MKDLADSAPSTEAVLDQPCIDLNTPISKDISSYSRAQYRAVINWLTRYKPQSNDSNLEKVRSYLESFYHLCGAEDWQRAGKILSIHIITNSNCEFHNQLRI